MIAAAAAASSPVVGSSQNTTLGAFASATARLSRRACPPLSARARADAHARRPIAPSRSDAARARNAPSRCDWERSEPRQRANVPRRERTFRGESERSRARSNLVERDRERDVLLARQARPVTAVLRDERAAPPVRRRGERAAVEAHVALGAHAPAGRLEGQQPHERRLGRAGRPHDREHAAAARGAGDAAQQRALRAVLAEEDRALFERE